MATHNKSVRNVRIMLLVIITLIDIMIVPTILEFPRYVVKYGLSAPTVFFDEINLFRPLKLVITDSGFRNMFLIFQPLVVVLMFYLMWNNSLRRKETKLNGLGGPKAAGSGEFGTSRWMSKKEVEKVTEVWNTNKIPLKGGLVLGMEKDSKGNEIVWLETQDTHSLWIGTTRSGKSRTGMIPTINAISEAGESLIINDPKGELYTKTHQMLRDKGYKIILLDFRNPGRGNKWNPMNLIVENFQSGNESLASESAFDMAHTIIHQKPKKGDSIWQDGPEAIIAAMSLAVAMEAPEKKYKTLFSVYNSLLELGQPVPLIPSGEYVPLTEYFKDLPRGHLAKLAYGAAGLAPDRQRGSFYTGVASELRLFSDPGIAHLTSDQDHELDAVGKEKTAVFMIVPDEKSTRHVMASLYIDQTYQALVKLSNTTPNGRLPVRVNFLLDEFGNMPPISDFATKITVAAGRGIRYHLVVQDFGQLKLKYGEQAGVIKNNCLTKIYLLTSDMATAEEISKMTGRYTVETQNVSVSAQNKNITTSSSLSSSLTGRPLLDPHEITKWEYGNSLVFLQRQNPIHLPLPDYSEWKFADKINEFLGGDAENDYPISKVPIYILGSGVEESEEEEKEEPKKKTNILDQLDNHSDESLEDSIEPSSEEVGEQVDDSTEIEVEDDFVEEEIHVEEVAVSIEEIPEVNEDEAFEFDEEIPIESIDLEEAYEEVVYQIEEENSQPPEEKENKKKFSLNDLD